MSHIKPTVRHRGCATLTHTLFGPPRMKRQLHGERNLVFALALCMFDNDETIHNYVLQTIYKRLAGTKLDCPRYGNHWEVIGFQGECNVYYYMAQGTSREIVCYDWRRLTRAGSLKYDYTLLLRLL